MKSRVDQIYDGRIKVKISKVFWHELDIVIGGLKTCCAKVMRWWLSDQNCHWAICVRAQACLWPLCAVHEPFSRLSPFPWRPQYRMGALPLWSLTSPLSLRSATWPTCPSLPSSSAQQVRGQLKSFYDKIKISGPCMFVFYGVYLLAKKIMKRKGFQSVSQNDTSVEPK